jgi:hypothetical protein
VFVLRAGSGGLHKSKIGLFFRSCPAEPLQATNRTAMPCTRLRLRRRAIFRSARRRTRGSRSSYCNSTCATGRGIFRLRHFPSTFGDEDLVPVWRWTDQLGVFSHVTALALHELSDALPSRHHVTVPLAWRARRLRTPHNVVLHYADLGADERGWSGPVPVTTPLRTIEDAVCAALDANWIAQATEQGVRRGLFTRQDVTRAVSRGEKHAAP